ncbi:hypothetical protein [Nostoc sp. LEGE 12450]|nr:hypothetical protein [Nostoc sp. LEGE 12450]
MAGVQQGQNNGSRGSMTITVSDLYIELAFMVYVLTTPVYVTN